jgi:hypothetical protein
MLPAGVLKPLGSVGPNLASRMLPHPMFPSKRRILGEADGLYGDGRRGPKRRSSRLAVVCLRSRQSLSSLHGR